MAEIGLQRQNTYAKVLKTQWGYPLLVPTGEIEVGDIGYLLGTAFARAFNVFHLTKEVSPLARQKYLFSNIDCGTLWC